MRRLGQVEGSCEEPLDFSNRRYLVLARNFVRCSFLPVFLFASSPLSDRRFFDELGRWAEPRSRAIGRACAAEAASLEALRARGIEYLKKIRLGEIEFAFLSESGLGLDSVIEAGRRVFLRRNSNISAGGDPIDFTAAMPGVYKRFAVQATAALGARISGVDMIVPEIADSGPIAA